MILYNESIIVVIDSDVIYSVEYRICPQLKVSRINKQMFIVIYAPSTINIWKYRKVVIKFNTLSIGFVLLKSYHLSFEAKRMFFYPFSNLRTIEDIKIRNLSAISETFKSSDLINRLHFHLRHIKILLFYCKATLKSGKASTTKKHVTPNVTLKILRKSNVIYNNNNTIYYINIIKYNGKSFD